VSIWWLIHWPGNPEEYGPEQTELKMFPRVNVSMAGSSKSVSSPCPVPSSVQRPAPAPAAGLIYIPRPAPHGDVSELFPLYKICGRVIVGSASAL